MDFDNLRFNEDHYRKVRMARQEKGLPTFKDLFPESGTQFGHEVEGKKLRNTETNEIRYIQSVHKHWYHGWYIMIMIYKLYDTDNEMFITDVVDGKNYERSHSNLFWENISCDNEVIVNSILENKTLWTIIE